jgi:ribonuclease VapC
VILFVDASAAVAMILGEEGALDLADRIDEARELIWSPLAMWETVAALARERTFDVASARRAVTEFEREWGIRTVTIGTDQGEMAVEAYAIYGKRSGSKAKLNMGDCFAYGCARTHQARLLYKGDDFVHTDLA